MNFRYENQKYKQGYTRVIGCDEVGRGCLAGPVVAAAVVFSGVKSGKSKVKSLADIRDSKLLSPEKREELSVIIKNYALAWAIGVVDEKTIDAINIHHASLLAMKRAVEKLTDSLSNVIPEFFTAGIASQSEKYPGSSNALKSGSRLRTSPRLRRTEVGGRDDTLKLFVAIDGKFKIPDFNLDQEAIIDGDNKILSIAAASVIAKVYRDGLMRELHHKYPIYNLAQHKGYATLLHRTSILKNGLSPIHRRSFCEHLATSP